MADSEEKGSNKTVVWVIVLASVGVGAFCIIGILAAIAIPAFTKYVTRSKASESEAQVQRIADEVAAKYAETCEWPDELPRHVDPLECCGGEKCAPDPKPQELWDAAGIQAPLDPTYFAYSTEKVDEKTYKIIAESDFNCGGPRHTYELTLKGSGSGSNCTAEKTPAILTNEFE